MKKKIISEEELEELLLPGEGQTLGTVVSFMGARRAVVACKDGKRRLCRIRGKFKRRMWVKQGDVVLVSPWDFDENQGDIEWRYTSKEIQWLKENGYITEED